MRTRKHWSGLVQSTVQHCHPPLVAEEPSDLRFQPSLRSPSVLLRCAALLLSYAADCMAMPHLATMAIAGVTAVMVIAAHGVLSLAEVTPNPVSQNWLASAHSEVEVKTWVFKTLIVLAANILVGHNQVQSIIILIPAGWIVYVHIRYVSGWCIGSCSGSVGWPAGCTECSLQQQLARQQCQEAHGARGMCTCLERGMREGQLTASNGRQRVDQHRACGRPTVLTLLS